MAIYTPFAKQGNITWCLVRPMGIWEVLRTAWMLYRYPDKVQLLVGVNDNQGQNENQRTH